MRYLLNLIGGLYRLVVLGKEKAVVAFVIAAIGSFVVRHGFTLDANLAAFLQAALIGLFGHLSVYFTSNRT